LATYSAQISTIFAYTNEKFQNFCAGIFQAKGGNLEGMLLSGVQLKRCNFGQWELFWELVDIPRMCLLYSEFWWGTYGLGTVNPEKPKFRRPVLLTRLCWRCACPSHFNITLKG